MAFLKGKLILLTLSFYTKIKLLSQIKMIMIRVNQLSGVFL
ncbi:hypothetical protein [Coxiella burnetii]|nr:hypothetical protein [Coxiella burnetii]ABX79133.1 hypothetical protein COXBURSA331_A0970 [Coxiella burnetii RSA 331]AIT63146.1 hypothetical protein CBNA_0846 [Coxiella burnetii str. Namibia]MDE3401627.1 hypothetical protein [Coxiella burnetii]